MMKKFYLLVLVLVINSTALGPPVFVVNLPKENGPQTMSCRMVAANGPQALVPGATRALAIVGLCSEPGRAGWGSVLGVTLAKGQFVLGFQRLSCIYSF